MCRAPGHKRALVIFAQHNPPPSQNLMKMGMLLGPLPAPNDQVPAPSSPPVRRAKFSQNQNDQNGMTRMRAHSGHSGAFWWAHSGHSILVILGILAILAAYAGHSGHSILGILAILVAHSGAFWAFWWVIAGILVGGSGLCKGVAAAPSHFCAPRGPPNPQ